MTYTKVIKDMSDSPNCKSANIWYNEKVGTVAP